jgi:hypothetical protein
MAWLESTGADAKGLFTGSTLYKSPLALDRNGVRPQRVADVACPSRTCGITLSSGFVTAYEWNRSNSHSWSLALVRLSDGAKWTVPGISGYQGGTVANGELWMPDTQRIELSSLGAPSHR